MSIDVLVPAQSVLAGDGDVVALLEGGERFDAADGSLFVLGESATALVMAAGDDLSVSGVRSAREIAVVGPLPDTMIHRVTAHYRCRIAGGCADRRLPLHVFVRTTSGLLYLGVAGDEGVRTTTMSGDLAAQRMELVPAVSRGVLEVVRPIDEHAPVPGVEWLDAAAHDRVAALRGFITRWYPPTTGVMACVIGPTAAVGPLPRALAELYRVADGRDKGVLGMYECIRTPDRLQVEAATGRLRFAWGNEGDWSWACDRDEDDPAVWWTWDEWTSDGVETFTRREPERLSGFLLRSVLSGAISTATYRAVSAGSTARASVVGELAAGLARVPVQSLAHRAGRTALYVAPGLVVHVTRVSDDEFFVDAGATHRRALRPLVDLDIAWQEFAG